MFDEPDYLKIEKRGSQCAGCGKSLLEEDRHPSVLLDPEKAATPAAPTGEQGASGQEDRSPRESGGAPEGPHKQEAEESGYKRLDYCRDCWEGMKERAYFSFWISRRTEADLPPIKLNRAGRNVALLALFDSLSERRDEETDFAPHLFFLAHLLMKYKILKWMPGVAHPETGEPMLRFSRTDCDEEALVPDLDLPDETIVRIKEEIEEYLKENTGQIVRL
ncbi:MAG TPA: hypothetical protein VM492_14595 [Sumerlaeia bacterium]|nr:hypothetical protein [Sumerlaeia bacterium]